MNVDALVDEVAAARGLIHDYDRRELRELVEVIAAAVREEWHQNRANSSVFARPTPEKPNRPTKWNGGWTL